MKENRRNLYRIPRYARNDGAFNNTRGRKTRRQKTLPICSALSAAAFFAFPHTSVHCHSERSEESRTIA